MKFDTPEMDVKYFTTEDILAASSTTSGTEHILTGIICPAELPMD